MISSLAWVQRSNAASVPLQHVLSEQDYQEIVKETRQRVKKLASDRSQAAAQDAEDIEVVQKYQLRDYEESSSGSEADNIFTNIKDLTMEDSDDDELWEDDQESEKDDVIIRPSDYLLVATRTPDDDDDVTQLEYYVYEDGQDNLYVHHDIMLPSFALCLECINYSNNDTKRGNMVAVGTFDPEIEIWNLDYSDPVYPEWILGESIRKKRHDPYHHTDAVLCLSWNSNQPHLLASGSADRTIKLWDLNSTLDSSSGSSKNTIRRALRSFDTVHTDKVQTIQWNPHSSPWLLASGGCDHNVSVFDTREPGNCMSSLMSADIEVVKWDPFHEHILVVGDESGLVSWVDTRTLKSVSKVQAHDKAVPCLDISPFIPSLLLTGSLDRTIKLWDFGDPSDINCLCTKDFHLGKLFNAKFSSDSPFLVAIAGNEGDLTVWNLKEAMVGTGKAPDLEAVEKVFRSRLAG